MLSQEIRCLSQHLQSARFRTDISDTVNPRDCGPGWSVIRFQPGAGLGEHAHVDNYEIYYILGGHGIAVDSGEEVAVTTGDVVYTADGATHSIRDAGDGDLVMLACVIYENKAD